jgi:hypothetical protein
MSSMLYFAAWTECGVSSVPVADFLVRHHVARLTLPKSKYIPCSGMPSGNELPDVALLFPCSVFTFCRRFCSSMCNLETGLRRSQAKEIANSLYFSLLAGNSRPGLANYLPVLTFLRDRRGSRSIMSGDRVKDSIYASQQCKCKWRKWQSPIQEETTIYSTEGELRHPRSGRSMGEGQSSTRPPGVRELLRAHCRSSKAPGTSPRLSFKRRGTHPVR